MNWILYKVHRKEKLFELFISETEFDRDMSQLVQGAKHTRAITFPSTVIEVEAIAFSRTSLESAVLNEDLETLG